MTDVEERLAAFVADTTADSFPDGVLAQAKRAVLDTLAAMFAAGHSDLAGPVLSAMRDPGPGSQVVIGTDLLTGPERAAIANGTLAHALDFDDTVSLMPGHPSSVILPALLATAGQVPRRGIDLLRAYVVGHEVATKMGKAIGQDHYNRGWHSTGTIGVFGAAAAVSNLLGLDSARARHALAVSTSMSSGLRVGFGTMTKSLHSGWAAAAGLTAALLAERGLTGADHALTGPGGFFGVYGTEVSDPDELLTSLGDPYTLLSPGVTFKRYSCCYALHRAIDAVTHLRAEGVLGGSDVVSVSAHVPPGSMRPLPCHRPTTGLEGKFSMEYVLAVGIHDGDYGLGAFTDEAVRRPAVQALLDSVSAVEDPECAPGDPEGRRGSAGSRGFVEVRVELADGRTARHRVDNAPGSPSRPLHDHELREKFDTCWDHAGMPRHDRLAAAELVEGLDEVDDVRVLLSLLVRGRARTWLEDGLFGTAEVPA
ncbi:MmgE/PrpD family protein [Actinophytocola oryzae]|uniref:2-methylcitrate dehydratase PrpD n=1 Tax=Actinophytocola oryzae TaxID=502181 RepID=A0A4R7W4V7_9PSEU|nr:MmgE/PrpD family protein [Actinophytocola oryzae]TDV57746.1 2-methylcitrate dehydratase PrpD [Actinophytocola oryzae]